MALDLSRTDMTLIFWSGTFLKSYTLLTRVITQLVFQNSKLLCLPLASINIRPNITIAMIKLYPLNGKSELGADNFATNLIIGQVEEEAAASDSIVTL